ncbi:hypothetical protein BDF20DRAFT_57170 [Mycotypha africana]|uniref:uncharacterized protein n=1 Tax=Mycotypha africana TaxID=64632 RepID=UPI0023003AC4|nr:uncharacterized protein BDF20DRAFT_57170 [Mycotypha africana]KAI8991713.1 hypothetical protein BDF20DRAFT_57170 [Mycotypha africana]
MSFIRIDWRLQALWYPLMRSLIDKPLPVTREFIDITGGLNGLFTLANEEDGENSSVSNKGSYDNALLAGWCDVFHTCGLSTGLTDDLFKNTQYSTQWSYNLVSLWTHPSECQIISECFRRVLYPAHSLAVPAEYKNLLQYFLGRLYDSCEFSTIMNNHDDHTIIPFVQKLRNEDTKAYFIVLHVIQLLSVQLKSSTNDAADKHGKYYVANLVKMLQVICSICSNKLFLLA